MYGMYAYLGDVCRDDERGAGRREGGEEVQKFMYQLTLDLAAAIVDAKKY